MKNLSPMINSAIEEDKEGFLDSFVKEFVNRVNEKVSVMHDGIRKMYYNQRVSGINQKKSKKL